MHLQTLNLFASCELYHLGALASSQSQTKKKTKNIQLYKPNS